jgi:hypothetical protein
MVMIIKKGRPISEIMKKLNELTSHKMRGLNASKYAGTLKTTIDPLTYQSSIRNEWK